MNKDKSGRGCEAVALLIPLGFVVYLIVQIVRFFTRPDAMQDVLICFQGLAMLAGACILLVAATVTVSWVKDRLDARLVFLSGEYLVRCEIMKLQEIPAGPLPDDLPVESDGEPLPAVVFLCALTNHGLRLQPAASNRKWTWIPTDNRQRFKRLSGDSAPALFIPIHSLHLFYYLAGENRTFAGVLPDDSAGGPIEIVIVCTGMDEDRKISYPVSLQHPLRFILRPLDAGGTPHQGATRDLYAILLKAVTPVPYDEYEGYENYGSRPIY